MIQKLIIISFLFIVSCKDDVKVNIDQAKESKIETQEISSIESNKKCDIEKVISLKEQLPNVSNESIRAFLSTISADCKNNVEFSQFSNEVLFEVLEAKPIDVILIIGKENTIDKDEVYRMLESPINESVNLNKLIANIDEIKIQSTEKTKFLEVLKKALDKYN
ncbi:hypothetical protein [Aquimarina megaterium]|uniref:hypothetical protein n=1 Tax=Aquimarina megaterium TaxID=1443666 RepID=UPI0004716D54|nr:hypothetical protein [Aquimarina megaterium]